MTNEVRIEMAKKLIDLALETIDEAFKETDDLYLFAINYVQEKLDFSREIDSWEGKKMHVEDGVIVIEMEDEDDGE